MCFLTCDSFRIHHICLSFFWFCSSCNKDKLRKISAQAKISNTDLIAIAVTLFAIAVVAANAASVVVVANF